MSSPLPWKSVWKAQKLCSVVACFEKKAPKSLAPQSQAIKQRRVRFRNVGELVAYPWKGLKLCANLPWSVSACSCGTMGASSSSWLLITALESAGQFRSWYIAFQPVSPDTWTAVLGVDCLRKLEREVMELRQLGTHAHQNAQIMNADIRSCTVPRTEPDLLQLDIACS